MQPYFQQKKLREFCNSNKIVVESWAPIAKGRVLDDDGWVELMESGEWDAVQQILDQLEDFGMTRADVSKHFDSK